jgi:di/tricarboxylate transporter
MLCHADADAMLTLCCAVLQVAAFGKTTLGLTYSLVLGEAVLSPAIPSVAARAGGIFFPLAKVRASVMCGL